MIGVKENSVVVVVPIYKEQPSKYDLISLTQCFKILSNYNIVAVRPYGLDISNYLFDFADVLDFQSDYFADLNGYNRLLMSPCFYEAFLDYDFLLVHQTDAFVFSDQLKRWCEADFDYLGAPWFYKSHPDFIKATKEKFFGWLHRRFNVKQKGTEFPTARQTMNMVGNGGFSLRRVRKFHSLSISEVKKISEYVTRAEHYFNEDIFWSIEVNRNKTKLKIPNCKVALNFSVENCPELALSFLKNTLPFGCHAWDRHIHFWAPFFLEHGYDVLEVY